MFKTVQRPNFSFMYCTAICLKLYNVQYFPLCTVLHTFTLSTAASRKMADTRLKEEKQTENNISSKYNT